MQQKWVSHVDETLPVPLPALAGLQIASQELVGGLDRIEVVIGDFTALLISEGPDVLCEC